MHWRQFQELQKVAEVGERFISYVDAGEGAPLVLLHGLPTWGYLWHRLLPTLENYHRVLVPDLPGYGFSDRSDRFDRSLAAQERAVCSWLDGLGVARADFIGHEAGAAVALRLAARRPERVDKLCLIDALAYDSPPIEIGGELGGRLRQGFRSPDAELIEGLLAPCSTQLGRLSLRRNAAALEASQRMELVPALGALSAPCLVLWGERDALQPLALGRRLAEDLPRAGLCVLPGSGHFPMLEEPAEVSARLRDFLALGLSAEPPSPE